MIELYDWSQSIGETLVITDKIYDIAFTSVENLDDRSDWSVNYLKGISERIIRVEYKHANLSMSFDEQTYSFNQLEKVNFNGKKLLIDSTSLSFPEILHLFLVFERTGQSFDVIYAQPLSYKKEEIEERNLNDIETYSLSDDGIGPKQLQPFINYSNNIVLTVCLGFEGHRLGSLLHSEEYNISALKCILGIPAFKAGWENETLSNNYRILKDVGAGMKVTNKVAPANDPISIYDLIDRAYTSSQYLKKDFFLAPFGTKPAAIAAAQFAVNKKKLVVIYDFVKKKQKRTNGTDLVHFWKFKVR